jgi:hypothetical protein
MRPQPKQLRVVIGGSIHPSPPRSRSPYYFRLDDGHNQHLQQQQVDGSMGALPS